MHWLFSNPDGFDLFTDHNNLVSFDPLAVCSYLSQTTVRKVLRWAQQFSLYTFTYINIKRNDNVWTDLMSRWSAVLIVRRLVEVPPLLFLSSEAFWWPTMSCALEDQNKYFFSDHPTHNLKSMCIVSPPGTILVSLQVKDPQMRLYLIAPTFASGY